MQPLCPCFLSSLVVKVFWATAPHFPPHLTVIAILNFLKKIMLYCFKKCIAFVSIELQCCINFQFNLVAQLCPTLCDPMDCSTPGFLVHHQALELIQTHVHQVSDAIQPSHPLSSPSPLAFNLSQHQGLFK